MSVVENKKRKVLSSPSKDDEKEEDYCPKNIFLTGGAGTKLISLF